MKNNIIDSSKIKILVCCHKPCELPKDDIFLPIQVGAAISDVDLGIQRDDQVNGKPCDNISAKNKSYCELTAMYWAWKNIKKLYPDLEYIGLNHYRRYFDFSHIFSFAEDFVKDEKEVLDYKLEKGHLQKLLRKYQFLVSKRHMYKFSMFYTYCLFYNSEDYRLLKEAIKEKQSDFFDDFVQVMEKGNVYSPYNMFVMSWQNFDAYCSWLFSILETVENRSIFEHYSPQQMRLFGYMSEFLTQVYLHRQKKHAKEIMVNVYRDDLKQKNGIFQMLMNLRCRFVFLILKYF